MNGCVIVLVFWERWCGRVFFDVKMFICEFVICNL